MFCTLFVLTINSLLLKLAMICSIKFRKNKN